MRRDFVANVSHELKTPLTSISGYAETLLSDNLEPDISRRFVATIAGNARRMQRLVDDLLDLARLEAGAVAARARADQSGRRSAGKPGMDWATATGRQQSISGSRSEPEPTNWSPIPMRCARS